MKSKIAKWGNSLGLRLPKAAADAAGLKAGADVEISIEAGELRVRPAARIPHYRLEDLLAEMDRLGPAQRPDIVDWGPDRGAEIIDDDFGGNLAPSSRRSRMGRSPSNARPRTGRRQAGGGPHGS